MEEKITFSFGKNWENFLGRITEDKLKSGESSIKDFTGIKNFNGKSVLDIGCGSGIFSYAFHKMGAKKIVSFDIDPFSVRCCEFMKNKAKNPKNWTILQGSILDKTFISKQRKFDFVYSWGALHHTGKMWEAIKNSARLVKKGGYYYITIYNKTERKILGSDFWLKIKKFYNRCPLIGKYILEPIHVLTYFALNILKLKNPLKKGNDYRGMSWRRDITDWLGGYPYEYATIEEILTFIKTNFPDFKLKNMKIANGLNNNWFLFQRKDGEK